MQIEPGNAVILVLHSPREKLFGVLKEINSAGVYIKAIDLEYFDDWCRSIAGDEPYLPMNEYFLPMWRLERLMNDTASPSMTEQFEQRTGRRLRDM
jgi:hypothetical protein